MVMHTNKHKILKDVVCYKLFILLFLILFFYSHNMYAVLYVFYINFNNLSWKFNLTLNASESYHNLLAKVKKDFWNINILLNNKSTTSNWVCMKYPIQTYYSKKNFMFPQSLRTQQWLTCLLYVCVFLYKGVYMIMLVRTPGR